MFSNFWGYILPLLKYKKKSLFFVYFICLHKYFAVKLAASELLAVEISDDWIIGNKKTKHIFNSQEYGYRAYHERTILDQNY